MIASLRAPAGTRKFQLSKDLQSIELLRGIASIMVCFFHLSGGNNRYLPVDSFTTRIGSWGWSGVEIFFVISGFIIPYSMFQKQYVLDDFGVFLKKRIIRIEPPYIVSILLVIALNYVSTLSPYYRGAPFHVDWLNTLGHLAYVNRFTGATWMNPVYWSLAIEFQYYLLIAVSFPLIISQDSWKRMAFFVVFALLSFVPAFYDIWVFRYAPYFLAGISLFQLMCGRIDAREFGIFMVADALLLYHHDGIVLGLITFAALLIIANVNKVPLFFRKLGLISYSLYLIHVPLGGRIINLAETKVHSQLAKELIVYATCIFCIGFAYLFYIAIERVCKRYAAGIKYKHRSAEAIS
jgi:peptidoglycan/LPS O-acetylase OafA/YrhL